MSFQRARRGLDGRQKPGRVRLQVESLEGRIVPTNYFVSTLGADIAGAGSAGAPFRSIQYAVNQAQSGDRIHVATGTYGYNPAADQLSGFLHINPAAVMIYDKSLQIFGGFDNGFTTLDPTRFRTVLDGGSAVRGVYVLGNQVDVSLDMEGFTVEAGLAQGERNLDINSGNDRIFGFGGGMWINDFGRANSPTPGQFTLRDMTFFGNRAVGLDTTQLPAPEPGQVPGVGGAGAGGAIALRYVPNLTLQRVTFTNNEADGGTGAVRGGDAVGGAIHSDHAHITGDNVVFVSNHSIAGNSNGSGLTQDPGGISGGLQRRTADGLAGAAAIQIQSSATLQNVVAFNNAAVGGNSSGQAGSGEAGAFLVEDSNVTLTDADLRHNLARGGNGQDGGLSGGGGLATDGANLTLNRVQVINNSSEGGGGTRNAGSPGGGGLYLVAIKPGDMNQTTITNSVIADNVARFAAGGSPNVGGGGGGVWLQGMNATFTHVTFAENHIGDNLFFGHALLLINDGLNNGPAPTPTAATLNDCIVANHLNTTPAAVTVQARGPSDRNLVAYNRVLFANNTTDDNHNLPRPEGIGTYSGLDTIVHAADAGFVSPGAPNFDYALKPNSPAVHAAVGSTTTTDIEQRPRIGVPDLGAYQAPAAAVARDTVASYNPACGLWQIRNSNSPGFPNLGMFLYGLGAGLSTPVAGDWDGNGTVTIGVVEVVPDPNNPTGPLVLMWKLRNSLGGGAPDITPFVYGKQGDIPVSGKWDGGPTTTIGIYETDTGIWKLRNNNSGGAPDATFGFGGLPGTVPVVGDWDGNGTTTVGVVESSGGVLNWKLRNSNSSGGADAGVFAFGGFGFKPVAGDWLTSGRSTAGVLDQNGTWYLRRTNAPGGPDAGLFAFGQGDALPLAGDWDNLPARQAAARELDPHTLVFQDLGRLKGLPAS